MERIEAAEERRKSKFSSGKKKGISRSLLIGREGKGGIEG